MSSIPKIITEANETTIYVRNKKEMYVCKQEYDFFFDSAFWILKMVYFRRIVFYLADLLRI